MSSLIASFRLVAATIFICVVFYTLTILGFAKIFAPNRASGSLIENSKGVIIGSRLIAQKFTKPEYFWPRPSAFDYNGSGAGGSNKSPTSSDVTERAKKTVADFGATPQNPLPADLAAASGGGLDPHITIEGALFQAERVAKVRSLSIEKIKQLIQEKSFSPGGFMTERLVNVLELNLSLDGTK